MSTARLFAILALLNILWAPTNFMIKVLQDTMSPSAVVSVRWIFFSALLWLLFAIPKTRNLLNPTLPQKADRFKAVLIGFFCVALSYNLYSLAVTMTSTIEANILSSTYPVVMGLFAFLFLKERVGAQRWTAIAIGIVGAYIVSVGFALPSLSHRHTMGNFLFLCGLVLECAALTMATRIVLRSSGLGTLAFESLGAALGTLAYPLILPGVPALRIDSFPPSAVAYMFYLVAVGGVFAFGAWYVLVENAPVSLMMLSTLIQPPIAAVLGYLYLNETVTRNTVIGSAAIVIGLVVAAAEKDLGVSRRKVPSYEAS